MRKIIEMVTPEQALVLLRQDLDTYLDDCIQARVAFDPEIVEGYIFLLCDAAKQAK